ncbi:MAG: DUF2231 domain-containing protein [Anaerolineae bacterium]|jgi:uncharacterized membrane protein|nr:DUF2231 domain-containing protein [Anaerolineae bacterium]
MDFLFPFHPRFVHFPIALSLVGVAFVAVSFVRGGAGERWFWAGRLLIFLGWIGALIAGVTGMIDQSRAPDLPVVRDTINSHISVGIALIIVFGLALYWPLKDKQLLAERTHQWGYLALLLLGVGLILLESWLGGQLVYKLGVGVQ